MNKHARKAACFLALSIIFAGCSSPTPEVGTVEQEVAVETQENKEVEEIEEIEEIEAVDAAESEEEAVIETEESQDNIPDESTVQIDADLASEGATTEESTTEESTAEESTAEESTAEESTEQTEPVEAETTAKEEPRVEEANAVEESSTEKLGVGTPTLKESVAEEIVTKEVVVEEPVVNEVTVQEPIVETPVVEEVAVGLTGTFSATGNSYDDYGWKPSLSLTFENGAITSVNYDEINADGGKKSGDTGYLSYFNQQTGVKLDEVYKTLSKNLLAVQTPEDVDSISGATVASDNFVKLAQKIIDNN